MTTSILTYIFGLPLLAALGLVFVPRNYRVPIRGLAILAMLISAILAVKMFCQFVPGAHGSSSNSKFRGWTRWASAITWAWTA